MSIVTAPCVLLRTKPEAVCIHLDCEGLSPSEGNGKECELPQADCRGHKWNLGSRSQDVLKTREAFKRAGQSADFFQQGVRQ